ncbi:hypothetical protein HMPREF9374_3468 [Desmospora sp. 8437]|nr:hypothetical protein HMPREF9374_3468 [Desmospora sp. 8437]
MLHIETYPDPNRFFEGLTFDEESLHVTGIQSLRVVLQKQADPYRDRIMHLDELMKFLYPSWYGIVTDYVLASKMRHLLEEEGMEEEWKRRIRQSLPVWVKAFRFAAALRLDRLTSEGGMEERCFARLYERMMTEDAGVRKLVERRRVPVGNILRKKRGEVKTLYVYHLQQLDAERMLFFRECERSGIRVVFRFPYHAGYEPFFRGWKELYEQVAGTVEPGLWSTGEELQRGGDWFRHRMGEPGDGEKDPISIRVLRFPSPARFREYARIEAERGSGVRVVAPSYDELNQSLRDLPSTDPPPPEENRSRKPDLPHHPAVRFLHHLYQARKVEGEIQLTYETLVECITSGWVQAKEIPGTWALPLLLELEPYLKTPSPRFSIGEIKERLQTLEALQAAGREFDQLAGEQSGRNRIKQYLSNPLRAFSFVHEERGGVTVRQLSDLVDDLEDKLKRLLPEEGEGMLTRDHFGVLRRIWQGVKRGLAADVEAIRELEEVLRHPLTLNWRAERDELHGLMSLFLRRKGEEERCFHCRGLEQLDGLALSEKPLHLADLSIRSLVKSHRRHRSLPAPLTLSWLKSSIRQERERGGLTEVGASWLLHALLVHHYSDRAWQRFVPFQLFYTLAYGRGELTVSWTEGWNEHDGPSSDWELFAMLYGKDGKGSDWEGEAEDEDPVWEEPVTPREETEIPAPDIFREQIPGVYWTDLDLCPRKFFLTGFLEHFPVYTRDFHHRLVFAQLGSLLTQQAEGEEGVQQHFSPLFPQWTTTLKENLIRTNRPADLRDYGSFQNLVYPLAMERLQRLRSSSRRRKYRDAHRKGRIKEKEWLKEWIPRLAEGAEARPGSHCRMCPYLMQCTEGEFPIDDHSRSV